MGMVFPAQIKCFQSLMLTICLVCLQTWMPTIFQLCIHMGLLTPKHGVTVGCVEHVYNASSWDTEEEDGNFKVSLDYLIKQKLESLNMFLGQAGLVSCSGKRQENCHYLS
jgi:hypothetical protein